MADKKYDHKKDFETWTKEEKDYFDSYIAGKIQLSERYLQNSGYADYCKKIALYVEGFQAPPGIETDALKQWVEQNYNLIDMNKFQVQYDKKGHLFFVDNYLGEIERGYYSEFTKVKKVSTIRQDKNPRNDGIEFAVKAWSSQFEHRKRIWEQVRNPVIRYMLRYNLGFTRSENNSLVKVMDTLKEGKGTPGDINMEYYHPASVLLDVTAIKKFMIDSSYIIPFKRVPLERAKVFFESLGVDPDKVEADNDSSHTHTIYDGMEGLGVERTDWVTIYFPEYKMLCLDKYKTAVFEYDERKQLIEQELKELSTYHFYGVYNKTLGWVKHLINPYADPHEHEQWQFNTVPYLFEQSDISVYVPGPIGKLLVINDMINIIESLLISDARKRVYLRAFVKKAVWDELGDNEVLNKLLAEGGIIPLDIQDLETDLSKFIHFLELPDSHIQPLTELLQIMLNSLKRQGIRKEVLQGQLPNKTSEQMSGRLAREMKESNSTLLQPIVQNIEWAVGTENRIHYNMLAQEFGEDEWVEVTEQKKDDPKYLPIAKTTNTAGYIDYLSKAYPGLDPVSAHNKFKLRSDVQGEIRFKNPETGGILDPHEIENGEDTIRINHLKDENGRIMKFEFKIKMDFDLEDNELEEKVMITEMYKMHPDSLIWLEMFLESQGGTLAARKDEIIERVQNESRALQVMKVIEELGPEGIQAFMQFAKEWILRQQYNNALEKNGIQANTLPQGQGAQTQIQQGIKAA